MATITKVTPVSIATPAPDAEHSVSGLYAGEALQAGDACYIKSSDGKVYRSLAANDARNVVDGYVAGDVSSGDPCTLYYNIRFAYGSGLTPGSFVYLDDTTAGAINSATSTYGTVPVGRVIDAIRIDLVRSY